MIAALVFATTTTLAPAACLDATDACERHCHALAAPAERRCMDRCDARYRACVDGKELR